MRHKPLDFTSRKILSIYWINILVILELPATLWSNSLVKYMSTWPFTRIHTHTRRHDSDCLIYTWILRDPGRVVPVSGDLNLQGHLDVQQVLVVTQQQSNLLLGDLQIQLETPYPHLWFGDEMRRIGFTAGPHRKPKSLRNDTTYEIDSCLKIQWALNGFLL